LLALAPFLLLTASYARVKFNQPTQGMDFAIESGPLLLIAVKDHGLSKAERYRRLRVFPIAFLFARTVHENLGTSYHQTFDQPFIFVACGGTQGRIEITELKVLELVATKDRLTKLGHSAEVLPFSHARSHIDVQVADH